MNSLTADQGQRALLREELCGDRDDAHRFATEPESFNHPHRQRVNLRIVSGLSLTSHFDIRTPHFFLRPLAPTAGLLPAALPEWLRDLRDSDTLRPGFRRRALEHDCPATFLKNVPNLSSVP